MATKKSAKIEALYEKKLGYKCAKHLSYKEIKLYAVD